MFLSLFLLYLACRSSLLTPFARRVLNLPRLTAPFFRFCGAPSGCALGSAFRGSPRLMRLSSSAICGFSYRRHDEAIISIVLGFPTHIHTVHNG